MRGGKGERGGEREGGRDGQSKLLGTCCDAVKKQLASEERAEKQFLWQEQFECCSFSLTLE